MIVSPVRFAKRCNSHFHSRVLFNAVEGVKLTIPWFQAQWDPINQNETIVNQLPALLYDEITAQEYAAMLAASAKEYRESL